LAQTGASGTVYGFTGEQEDDASDLLYLRARYYNPALKVFQSRDPYPGSARVPASQNGYSYVHGNPVNYTDPTGECPICLIILLIAVSGCAENPTPTPISPPNVTTIRGYSIYIKTVNSGSLGQGLGTVVDAGKRIVLTHNHYGDDNPAGKIEAATNLIIYDGYGVRTQVNNFSYKKINPGVMLLDLDDGEIAFNQQAPLHTNPSSIPEGSLVQQAYWSGSTIEFFHTTVEEHRPPDKLTLKNKGDFIIRGDSGGGVFYQDQLIGNTWSMTNIETTHIALNPPNLPVEISSSTGWTPK
jgi:RHS repeat-associated protein